MTTHALVADRLSGRWQGQHVLITGAGRGFGAGIARGLAQGGARVAITDIDGAELDETRHEIGSPDTIVQAADVRDLAALERAVAACVARWGRLDAVIANAAVLPMILFDDLTPAAWQEIIGINLTGVYNTFKAAWPVMRQQSHGHCIAIASGASVRGSRAEVAYCAAKHGLEGMIKALAVEGEAANIAVNSVGPGRLIKPTSLGRAQAREATTEQRERWSDPVELAPAFGWLIAQPPTRWTGLRFDAAPLADAVAAEGVDFAFTPAKATLYTADFEARLADRVRWTTLASTERNLA